MTQAAHPLADLLPTMTPREYTDLKDSIGRNGLRRPIVMMGDQILTGRHRMKACLELGMTPAIRQYDPQKDGQLPVEFVLDEEINRRHMGTDQRAIFAAKLKNYEKSKELAVTQNEGSATNTEASEVNIEEIGSEGAEGHESETESVGSGATMAQKPPEQTANEKDGDGRNVNAVTESQQALMDKLKVGRDKLQQAQRVLKADPDIVIQIESGAMTLDEAEEYINRKAGATAYRKEVAELMSADYGDDVAEKVRNCELLYPDKDLKAFMGIATKEAADILATIEGTNWSARQAIQFHSAAFTGSDRLSDLSDWADWERARTGKKRVTFTNGGHKITFEAT